ncbi:MAG: hypothetical protein QM725_09785 [Lacibacter sp.]
MKITLTILLSCIIITNTRSQVVTYDDFKTIIPYLQKEDFKTAFEKTSQILNSTKNDSSDLRGVVTYMNIFSSAGMVSLGQMTYEDFSKNISAFKGQYIVMSAHPCIDSSKLGFNSLKFEIKDGQVQGNTASTNSTRTSIFCFENFKYAEPFNQADYIGKMVRCGGILESFETNPNKSTIWISRLYISNAFLRIVE